MQSDTRISMTSHTAHTFSVMRSQDACVITYFCIRSYKDGKMCFIEFFGLTCFSEETEFLFVSDYLYRSNGCFCLVGAVHA